MGISDRYIQQVSVASHSTFVELRIRNRDCPSYGCIVMLTPGSWRWHRVAGLHCLISFSSLSLFCILLPFDRHFFFPATTSIDTSDVLLEAEMSGFEIVGVMLGGIPLLIAALEHYKHGIQTIKIVRPPRAGPAFSSHGPQHRVYYIEQYMRDLARGDYRS